MPRFIGAFESRKPIAAFLMDGFGLIAGLARREEEGVVRLRDTSGSWPLPDGLVEQVQVPAWIAVEVLPGGTCELAYHQPMGRDDYADTAEMTVKRLAIHGAIRDFFRGRHFLETDTPVAVRNPGMEPFLDTFSAGSRWLRTSPELHMKRLLGMGLDRIFQMGPCFRKGDVGSQHHEEFVMLEWYRAFADLGHILGDLEDLLVHLSAYAHEPSYFRRKPEVFSCAELFEKYLNLPLVDCEDCAPLRRVLQARGIETDDSDDWDTLYFLAFLNFIEPHLGKERPTIVRAFPASQSALSKKARAVPGQMPTCHRFELYLRGMELANAFYELTDPVEQRKRFQQDGAMRARLGKPIYPIDENFMETLENGLPPCAGIALGVDRLVMSLVGCGDLTQTVVFGRERRSLSS